MFNENWIIQKANEFTPESTNPEAKKPSKAIEIKGIHTELNKKHHKLKPQK